MKKLLITLLLLAIAGFGFAQTNTTAAAPALSGEKNEWLPSFDAIEVSAPLDIVFVRVADSEAPKIVYDTKGSYTTKFKAEVKDRVLRISERADDRRPERTTVRVCYNNLNSVSISDAVASFEGVIASKMLDITIGGHAVVTATLDIKDLTLHLSGKSEAKLSGSVKYLTLTASTGKVDGAGLQVTSARVDASNSAAVTLHIIDRLEAATSMRGSVVYKGTPEIIRTNEKFLGGAINPLQ